MERIASNNRRKQAFRIGKLFLFLLMLAAALSACGDDTIAVQTHLVYDAADDVLVDEKTGIRYAWSSVSYEPATVSIPYADVTIGTETVVLYEVKDYSPQEILTEKYEGVGGLLYAEDRPLPTLQEMNPDKIYLCVEGKTSATCFDIVEDPDTIARAVSLLTDGEAVGLPASVSLSISLKFASNDNSGIYYNVVFAEGSGSDAGSKYLYDRGTRRCVQITDDLFSGILYEGDTATTEENLHTAVTDENGDYVFSFD